MPPVNRRYFHSTMLHNRGGHKADLLTVIPAPALSVLGMRSPRFVTWERTGGFYRITPSVAGRPGSRNLQNTRSHMAFVPDHVVDATGAADHDNLDWYLAAGRRWEIHVRLAGARPPRQGRPARIRNRRGGPPVRPFASTRLLRYNYEEHGKFTHTAVPKPCMHVMGAGPADYLHWERTGRSYRLMPARSAGPASRKILTSRGTGKLDHHQMRIPSDIAAGMPAKACSLWWDVAADGRGRWEVRVRPAGRS